MKQQQQQQQQQQQLNIQKTKIMASGSITSWQTEGEENRKKKKMRDFVFWALKSLQMVTAAMKLKDTFSLEEKL